MPLTRISNGIFCKIILSLTSSVIVLAAVPAGPGTGRLAGSAGTAVGLTRAGVPAVALRQVGPAALRQAGPVALRQPGPAALSGAIPAPAALLGAAASGGVRAGPAGAVLGGVPPAGTGAVHASVPAGPGVAGGGHAAGTGSRHVGSTSGAAPAPAGVDRAVTARQPFLASYVASHDATPRQMARHMLRHRFHWKAWQFKYLNRLWTRESDWNPYASNPYSGAYGIPQAVPGSKMSSAGPGWRSSPRTQIRWGMRYIRERYRSPYWAWRHECAYGWY